MSYRKLSFKEKALKYLLRSREVDFQTNCWLFTGRVTHQKGYGRIEINGKRYFVQRLALVVWRDFDIDSELFALHKQECPNKHCFNPEHLYAGNAQDNLNDAKALGHLSNGLCHKGHKLKYYTNISKGRKYRKSYCKICHKIYARARKARLNDSI